MKKVLVINAHQKYPYAEGRLNQTLFENIVEMVSKKHDVKTTVIEKGYLIPDEREKFEWADIIIFQFPLYWYSFPGAFKTYVDKVYTHDSFFDSAKKYGHGGLLKGKKYMFSVTMNTPENEFNCKKSFFGGKTLEDILFPLHKAQQYCGLVPLKTFAVYDVVKNPQILEYLELLHKHIKEFI